MATWGIGEKAAALHRDALVWDNHSCFPQVGAEPYFPQLERYRQSGVNVLGVNIGDSDVELAEMVRLAAALRDYIARNADRFTLIRTVADIATAKAEGKLAILLDIEGCYAMGDQLSLIRFYYDIGVRWMLMVYNARNLVGSGVHDGTDTGLTAFGRAVVAEMDRVGIIKCCSHTGYRTTLDTFAASTRPCIFSHSNPLALRNHPRNVPDELIDACAKTGGVIGVNGVGIFLGDNDISTATVVRHIDYIVQRVGAAHVGIGLDFVFNQKSLDDNLSQASNIWPAGFGYAPGIRFVAPEQLPEITEALLARGYKESEIRGILGENLLPRGPRGLARMSAIDSFADDVLLRMLVLRPDLAAEMGVTAVDDYHLPFDTLPDFSDAGSHTADAMIAVAAGRLSKFTAPQSGEDAITWRVVRYVLEEGGFSFFRGRAGHRFVDAPYPVNHLNGFHPILLLMLSRDHGIRTPVDAAAYLARLAQVPHACSGVEDALKSRVAKAIVAPRFTLLDSVADMRAFVATPPAQNILVTSFATRLADAHIPHAESLIAQATKLLETEIYPAYVRVIALVEDLARDAGVERGFWALPDGEAYYDWLLRASTTSDISPAAAHDLGHAEIARVQAAIRERFAALGIYGDSIAALYAQISDGPIHRYPADEGGRSEVWRDANVLMRRFEGATTGLFRTLPHASLDLVQVPAALEETMHTHYTPPAVDGSRPGRFSLNIALAQGNPRWELATLCAHEGTPGHHLQLALAQELPIASAFRRTVVFDAYIEGWAKYAETIPENHGLLDDPYAQLGRLRGELYSTVNLAMDTGVHAKRWTRDQARAFFRDNTGVSEEFAGVIADRSFVTPGQLCSYKVGMMNFLAARDRFQGRDIRDFHDCVLGHGALPLSVLDDVVSATLSGNPP